MDEKEHLKVVDEMTQLCVMYRGWVINHIIPIEVCLERIIVAHFASDPKKLNELFMVISNEKGISFETKVTIVRRIIDEQLPVQKSNTKTIFNTINSIQKDRNMMAHKKMATSKRVAINFDGDAIQLVSTGKTNNGTNTIKYTEFNTSKMNEYADKCNSVYDYLKNIELKIKGEG